jgi:hypothetical protein
MQPRRVPCALRGMWRAQTQKRAGPRCPLAPGGDIAGSRRQKARARSLRVPEPGMLKESAQIQKNR